MGAVRYVALAVTAWWQSGYAEDCKSLNAGSIPTQASIFLFNISLRKGFIMEENKLSFEDSYKQLVELVKKMESGELKLEDSVAAYEQGIKLKAYCEQLLKEAELKIEQLKVV